MPLPPLAEPKSFWLRLARTLRGLAATLFLFVTLIAFNVVQTASLLIKLFSQQAFRRANRWMANLWWGWCVTGGEKLNHTRVEFSGDDVPPRENTILVCNHQDMADITVLFTLARAKERLGDLKWYVKDIIKYVPGVGWGMLFLDCLFIKRNWTADRSYIQRVFEKILRYKTPCWVISFVEGTRVRPAKVAQSQEYAREQGLPVTEHVLLPRTKGFVATVQALRGHLDAVYDVTIGYVEGVPTLWQWIKGHVKEVHLHIRRFAIDELPQAEEELAHWLRQRFVEKDKLLAYYYQHGLFPQSREATLLALDAATG